MRTPKLKPEMEKLPLVMKSRAIDRVCDAAEAGTIPELPDLKIAASFIRCQQFRNLERGLLKSCDECGAEITKEGCANCLRKELDALKASSPNDKLTHGDPR